MFIHAYFSKFHRDNASEISFSGTNSAEKGSFGLLAAERYAEHLERTRLLLTGVISATCSEIEIFLKDQNNPLLFTGTEVSIMQLNPSHY
jgi:hypothetical protein